MIAAFAQAGAVLDRADYTDAAVRAAEFILTHMRAPDGRLFRTTAVDSPPKIDGYLEDYAFLIMALTHLYEATFDVRWLKTAEELAGIMVERFADRDVGGFFTTAAGQDDLIMRLKDRHDGSTPSGSAMAITGLLRLTELTGTSPWHEEADRGLRAMRGVMHDSPMAAAQTLIALDFALGPIEQVAIVGEGDAAKNVISAARKPFRPRRIVAFRESNVDSSLPLLADKPAAGPVATYICQNYACQVPILGVVESERQLTAESAD
jgi:hypothetical protein